MNLDVIRESKKFFVSYLKGKECGYETHYPWRKRWEFIVYHSLRVESYAIKILNGENHNLSDEEIELIRLSAILHDIGRINERDQHARISREIVEAWLKNNQRISSQIHNVDKLLYMIETHSDKDSKEEDFSIKVLRDADILDEIGVLSIFMASKRVDQSSPFFFNKLLERVKGFEINFCNQKMSMLNTITAKEVLRKKMDFINLFSDQLEDELEANNIELTFEL